MIDFNISNEDYTEMWKELAAPGNEAKFKTYQRTLFGISGACLAFALVGATIAGSFNNSAEKKQAVKSENVQKIETQTPPPPAQLKLK